MSKKILQLILIKLPLWIFNVTLLMLFSVYLFSLENDTTALTNVAFAMLMAIASVCFSYYRTLDDKDIEKLNEVRKAGEDSLIGALCFAIASALKYVAIKLKTDHSFFISLSAFGQIMRNISILIFYSFSVFQFAAAIAMIHKSFKRVLFILLRERRLYKEDE